jgi:hypothetical protein
MNTSTYHIEDLETLLLQKEYAALLPEEKAFVHQHIKDEPTYSQMRSLLYRLIEESQEEAEWKDPDPHVKQNLDALFSSTENTTPIIPFYQSKLFWSLTGVAALFLIGFFLFMPNDQPGAELAEVKSPVEINSSQDNQSQSPSEQANSTPVPPPPPPVVEKINFTAVEITEEEEVANPPMEDRIEKQVTTDTSHPSAPVSKNESNNFATAADQEESQLVFSAAENITYLSGDQQLQIDIANIVQRCLEKSQFDRSIAPFKIFVQLTILRDGKVQSAQVMKGGESYPALCQLLQTDLKHLGSFRFPSNITANSLPLTIPLNIHWQ